MADQEIIAEPIDEPIEKVEIKDDENQKEIPNEVKHALQKANKEAEKLRLKLKEFEDRDKTDAQKLIEERDLLKSELENLSQEAVRRDVAEEKGLTLAQARRLIGTTREELEADADELIATFPKSKPVFGDVGQGVRGDAAPRIYSRSELNNFSFFQKNKADILLAEKEGRITD